MYVNDMCMCLQDKIFTVEATIYAINAKFGWYYISCSRGDCKKQLDKNFDHYYCSKCGKNVVNVTRKLNRKHGKLFLIFQSYYIILITNKRIMFVGTK